MRVGGRPGFSAAPLAAWLILSSGPGESQLLYEPVRDYEQYYARTGHREYTASLWSQIRAPVFDELGNFLLDGTEIWRSQETRPMEWDPGSMLNKDPQFRALVGNLVVAHDTHKDWASRLMVGNRIRTKFTPLTLDLAQLNGIRWDVDLGSTQATAVSSRFDWPIYNDDDNEFHMLTNEPTYLLGGHLAHRAGALRVSLSYANLLRTDSFVGFGDNSLKGVLPSRLKNPPAWLAVRISDGSEDDGRGARVYDVRVEGPLNDAVEVSVTRHDADVVNPHFPNGDRAFRPGFTIPPYIEFLKGDLPLEDPGAQGFLEANGTEYLIYWFKIPQEMRDEVESVRFSALVANDYRISLSEVFLPAAAATTSNPDLRVVRATFFRDVASQEGNVGDLGNLRRVSFEYGRQSGRTTGSLRLELDREGFQVRGEYARSFNYLQYPSTIGRSRWHRETADAFFVHAKKQLAWFRLAGEYFRMDPLYGTSLSVQSREYWTYSDDLGSPFIGEVAPNWQDRYNDTVILDTVDDNDDKDLWPDFHFLNKSFGDGDGVFPGLDRDQDGRTDVNENGNAEPDYNEPFLLYHVDPLEYDYGDDMNNNGVIDHREDDFRPDYPYPTDRKGYHLFGTVEPVEALELSAGRFHVREIWGPGENRVNYLRLNYRRTLFPYASIDFSDFFKRVHDDIADDSPQFGFFTPHGLPIDPTSVASVQGLTQVEDPLLMRDSVVNTAHLDATFLRVKDLEINSRLKHTVNRQRASAFQPADTIQEWAWVLRSGYTWKRDRWTVTPRAKYMAYRRRGGDIHVHPVSERYFYPMVVATVALSPQTSLSAGAQGFPFLSSTYRNLINDQVDYGSRDYIVSVTNRTTYEGYYLTLNAGYLAKTLRFEDRSRKQLDVERSLLFVRLLLGLEPFQG